MVRLKAQKIYIVPLKYISIIKCWSCNNLTRKKVCNLTHINVALHQVIKNKECKEKKVLCEKMTHKDCDCEQLHKSKYQKRGQYSIIWHSYWPTAVTQPFWNPLFSLSCSKKAQRKKKGNGLLHRSSKWTMPPPPRLVMWAISLKTHKVRQSTKAKEKLRETPKRSHSHSGLQQRPNGKRRWSNWSKCQAASRSGPNHCVALWPVH